MKDAFKCILLVSALGLWVGGCGGGAPTTILRTISVAVVPVSATTIVHAETIEFNATVKDDASNAGVTWSVTGNGCTADACGSISHSEPFHAHYTAPENPAATLTVLVTARSITDPTKLASVIVTVWPHLTISTSSLPDGSQGRLYTATVQNNGGMPPLQWAVSGSLPAGLTLNPATGVISGTPTSVEVAHFTVQVTDAANPAQVADQLFSIDITGLPGGQKSELKGYYTFLMNGYDIGARDSNIIGSFYADGQGNITDGMRDINEGGTHWSDTFTGTYSIGADHRGTMVLDTSDGPRTYAFVTNNVDYAWNGGASTGGRIIGFDVCWYAGEFRWKAPSVSTADLNGSFVFGASGQNGAGMRYAQVGRISLNGAGGVIPGGLTEYNDDGYVSYDQVIGGTYSVAANGRGTMILNLIPDGTVNLVFYVSDVGEMYLMSIDGPPQANYAGSIVKQVGSFDNSSLNGSAVNIATGRCPSNANGSKSTAGFLQFNGSGGVHVNYDENVCGVIGSGSSDDTYIVDANGRVVLGDGKAFLYLLYSGTTGRGFYLGTSDTVDFGWMEMQYGGPFNNSSLSGAFTYGVLPQARSQGIVAVGAVTPSAGGLAITTDDNNHGVTNSSTATDTYRVAPNGRMTTGSGDTVWYLVSPWRAFILDTHAGKLDPQASIADAAVSTE